MGELSSQPLSLAHEVGRKSGELKLNHSFLPVQFQVARGLIFR
jgi:hypothetical protein